MIVPTVGKLTNPIPTFNQSPIPMDSFISELFSECLLCAEHTVSPQNRWSPWVRHTSCLRSASLIPYLSPTSGRGSYLLVQLLYPLHWVSCCISDHPFSSSKLPSTLSLVFSDCHNKISKSGCLTSSSNLFLTSESSEIQDQGTNSFSVR